LLTCAKANDDWIHLRRRESKVSYELGGIY